MPKLVPIVEGEGEIKAVPLLLKKILKEYQRFDIQVSEPINAKGRSNLTKPQGLEDRLELARRDAQNDGVVFVILDTEEGCPVDLCKNFVERINQAKLNCPVVLVAANQMYENWILASIETVCGNDLQGRRGLPANTKAPQDVELVNGKIFLNEQFKKVHNGRAYKETLDQEAMTHYIDVSVAKSNSRSFRRLCHAVEEAIGFIDNSIPGITPHFPVAPEAVEPSEDSPKPGGRKKNKA